MRGSTMLGRLMGGVGRAAPLAAALVLAAACSAATGPGQMAGPDAGPPVKAKVKPYRVRPDLRNVAGLSYFAKALTPRARQMLARNLFVVVPATHEQPFEAYPDTSRQDPRFITLDAALHLWHLAYDYSLRFAETEHLSADLREMVGKLLSAGLEAYAEAPEGLARDAAERALAYLAVAGRPLGIGFEDLPEGARALAEADWQKVQAHSGMSRSATTGFDTLFDLMMPRGHYTRTEDLSSYFVAMSWLGQAYWGLKPGDERSTLGVASAVLLARLMYGRQADPAVRKLWDRIYEPTRFYVGAADDPTLAKLWPIAREVYGGEPEVAALGDIDAARRLVEAAARKLWPSKTVPTTTDLALPSVRLMPQRFVPDTFVMHHLVYDRVGQDNNGQARWLPRGLDVFAALGSGRAYAILTGTYRDNGFPGYTDQMARMRRWFLERPKEQWTSNLYWGWLWTLSAVAAPKPQGYPSFMLSQAWQDKQLWTALGSWAELRHDTILYAKQVLAEGEGPSIGAIPKAYVEPDVEAWRRLEALAEKAYKGLSERGLLKPGEGSYVEPGHAMQRVVEMLARMRDIAQKELTGKPLTREEKLEMAEIGGYLESMQTALVNSMGGQQVQSWYMIRKPVERYMACVADVATGGEQCLEVGVGPAYDIYVVAPVEGKPTLCRGAVFSYFEFPWPRSDRLTDEAWLQMLADGKAPESPSWAASFLTGLRCPGFRLEERPGAEAPWEEE